MPYNRNQGQLGTMAGSRAKQAQNSSGRIGPPTPAEAPVVHVGGDYVARRNFFPLPDTPPALSRTLQYGFDGISMLISINGHDVNLGKPILG